MEAASLFFNKQVHILTRRLIFKQQYIIYLQNNMAFNRASRKFFIFHISFWLAHFVYFFYFWEMQLFPVMTKIGTKW